MKLGTQIALLIVLGAIIAFFYYSAPAGRDATPRHGDLELADYFEEQMTRRAIEDVGQPIEGFDADLLMSAYPGLLPEDFDGVQALEGRYEAQNGELDFLRDGERPRTSAAHTVSHEGYGTLLERVAERLGVEPRDEKAIDEIIEHIDTNGAVQTTLGVGASALGVHITPREILEDSRCPTDVECIQAGTVRLRTSISFGNGPSEYELELSGASIVGDEREVRLIHVAPEPVSAKRIETSEYTFTFEITRKRESEHGG